MTLTVDDDEENYILIIQQRIIKLFKLAGMNIRKWRTNLVKVDQQWSLNDNSEVNILG